MNVLDCIRARAHVPPGTDCVAWNEKHGTLSKRDSAMPGSWRIGNAPQMRHWLDLVAARKIGRGYIGERDQYAHLMTQLWLIAGTQSMKTRSLLYAAMGYLVDVKPSPKAYILPRLKDFKRVLDNRLRPFFTETPQLLRLFPPGKRDRSSAITYQAWRLITQTVYMLCGELADDLRSFPVCDLFWDEFDLLPLNVEGQGDPIELGIDRQKTWPRQKLSIGATTPTTVNGHGWRRLCSGSHERLLVKCPTCEVAQELHPDRLRFPKGSTPDEIILHRLATWACVECGTEIPDDGTKERMVAEADRQRLWVPGTWAIDAQHTAGLWTPHADFDAAHRLTRIHPPETVVRSGHLNSLYSRFISLSEFAAHGLAADLKGDVEERIAHTNGWRAEPWLPQIVAPLTMERVAEVSTTQHYFSGACPAGPLHIALICDQQGNNRASTWFPYEFRGFGLEGAEWQIEAGQAEGFEGLAALEGKTFNVGGVMMPVEVTAIDGSNGNMRVPLQEWAAAAPSRRFLLTGRFWPDYLWQLRQAGTSKEKRNKRIITGARVYNFHANAYKTELDGRRRGIAGAKAWHLPDDTPEFYLASMTAEEQKPQKIRIPGAYGKQSVLIWEPRTVYDQQGNIVVRTDNHWWDCSVMALVVAAVMEWENPPKRTAPRVISASSWFGRRN